MASFFKANDAVLAAIEIETRGKAFYLRLAAAVQEAKVQRLFGFLAEEEEKHKAFFQALYERLGKVDLPAGALEDEFIQYMNALIESHPLFQEEDMEDFKASQTRKSAIRKAMGFEKESILFFMELRDLVPASEQKFVSDCIEEERRHLRLLRDMLESA